MSTVPSPTSPSKKRKHRKDDDESTAKKRKKERKHKHKSDDDFSLVQASLVVSIPPVFASNPTQGVEEMLDSMIMRYIPTLRGVVITHSRPKFLESTARIQGDNPYAVCNVGFDATVWSPRVGQRLAGTINLCSPDHVSLLVHRTFNVSIPRHHIPQSEWTFEYGPGKNGEGYSAKPREEVDTATTQDAHNEGQDASGSESSGRWVHSLTGMSLGGDDARLEFTVIGFTIANQMLSLIGSIQPDPFSPEHGKS